MIGVIKQEGAVKLIDTSKNTGAGKFVMLSSMGADHPSVRDDLKDYLKAKKNTDDYLKASGLNYSIVRPGALTNESSTNKIQLKEKLEKQGSISRADVAKLWLKYWMTS